MGVSRPNVELHIEELVLSGFPSVGRQAIAAAVEAELGQLVADRGLPASLATAGSLRGLEAGSLEVNGSERPALLGQRIGRALYDSLGGEG